MSKRTLLLIFALFVITSVLLAVALYKPMPQPLVPQTITPVQKQPDAQTTLSFSEPSFTISSTSARTYSVPINISTGENKVTAVQLELQYDPKLLTNVEVVPGPFFTNPIPLLEQIDQTTGRISYAFGVNPAAEGVSGIGVVATITFRALSTAPLQTGIIFLPKTLVTAERISQSVLKESIDARINLGVTAETIASPNPPTQ